MDNLEFLGKMIEEQDACKCTSCGEYYPKDDVLKRHIFERKHLVYLCHPCNARMQRIFKKRKHPNRRPWFSGSRRWKLYSEIFYNGDVNAS